MVAGRNKTSPYTAQRIGQSLQASPNQSDNAACSVELNGHSLQHASMGRASQTRHNTCTLEQRQGYSNAMTYRFIHSTQYSKFLGSGDDDCRRQLARSRSFPYASCFHYFSLSVLTHSSMARNYEKRYTGLNRFLEAKQKGMCSDSMCIYK